MVPLWQDRFGLSKVSAVLKELVADQKKKQNEMIQDNQRKFFDQMLKIRKAEKREFSASTHIKVHDLMTLYAPTKPSILGCELARHLFGVGEKCELVLLILEKQTLEKFNVDFFFVIMDTSLIAI